MLKYRWSHRSLHLGILLNRLDEENWNVLWNDAFETTLKIDNCHKDVVVVIDDINLKDAGARWKVTGP